LSAAAPAGARGGAAAGFPPLIVRLRAPGEQGDGRAVDAVALLDEPVAADDEVRTPQGFLPVAETLGLPPGQPLSDWLRYTGLLVWMVALTEALWIARIGVRREPIVIVAGAMAAALLFLLRKPRWGMAFAAAAGAGAVARGLHDAARAFGTGAPWGAWLWICAPAVLGAGAAAMAAAWARSGTATRPLSWRLLTAAHGSAALGEAVQARRRARFADVPFGVVEAIGVVCLPYAVWWTLGSSSTLLFPAVMAAGGAALLVWARVRGASAEALGLSVRRLQGDVLTGLGALGLLLLGAQALFSLLDALEAALRAGPGAAAAASAALADASAGMAREEAASTATIAAGTTWRLYAVGALAAVAEELVFRGALYGALRRRFPVWLALLASSVPFALLHFEPWQSVQLAAGGVVLGLVYEARRTLWAPIALHLAWNLLLVAMT